jgi:hypothetical protein
MRRWLVERFFVGIQWQRRILVRWEFHAQNFLGFVRLACKFPAPELNSDLIAQTNRTPDP